MNSKRFVISILFLSLVTAVVMLSPNEAVIEARAETAAPLPQPHMVKNINTATPSSDPGCHIALDTFMLCAVDDGVHGRELWRSNGTETGSALIKDIIPGEEGSDPGLNPAYEAARIGKFVFFAAQSGEHGRELWKTDGTSEGTTMVKDMNPGTVGSYPYNLTAVGNKLFFVATHNNYGFELWTSDGTAFGTMMVRDIKPGDGVSSNPSSLVAMGDKIYFAADDGVNGGELWVSDGTVVGTKMVKNIYPGSDTVAMPYNLTVAGHTLFFAADDGLKGLELWRSDGTAGGTLLVKDINADAEPSNPGYLTEMNNLLYFAATSGGTSGLWRSDGTENGTILVKEIGAQNMITTGTQLFFTAQAPTVLWVSDGSTAGTIPLREFPLGFADCDYELFAAGNEVFACFLDGVYGMELWASDGTVTGTRMVRDIVPGERHSKPDPQIEFGAQLYFAATNGGGDRELWMTDGSEAGTTLAIDFNISEDADSYPGPFGPLGGNGNQIVFRAEDTAAGDELLLSDGSEAGTYVLKDINPGPGGSGVYSRFLVPVALANGRFFFAADDGVHGTEMWTSDGTETGTSQVINICPGSMGSSIENLVATQDAAFFTSSVPSGGGCSATSRLWKTEGSPGGTIAVVDEFRIEQLAAATEVAFYVNYMNELWAVDSNGQRTLLTTASHIGKSVIFKDSFYYYGQKQYEPGYLWKSDGTPAGTVQIKESGSIEYLFPANEFLYFLENEAGGTLGLWISDGTAAGTKLVRGGWPYGQAPVELTAVGDTAYFTAGDEEGSRDLWRTDGTDGGTIIVKDFHSPENGGPGSLTALDDVLFFAADDGVHGYELWVSDGTEAGTVMHADINPVAGQGSQLHNLAARDSMLYFAADDGLHGIELWALSVGEPNGANQRIFLPGVFAKN